MRRVSEAPTTRVYAPPVLIPEQVLRGRVRELGREIARDCRLLDGSESGAELVVLGVMKGAFVFLADLVRAMDLPAIVDFVGASSYGDHRASSGEVRLAPGVWPEIEGRDVLIVEDVLETGRTLEAIVAAVESRRPRSVRTVALLRKPGAHVKLDYTGFDIDDRFVVGYGLDDAGRWRQLPYVGYVEDGR